VAIAELAGGHIAREVKALVGSGAGWAANSKAAPKVRYRAIVDGAVRSADPFIEVRERWVIRRLAPDCSRIEFTAARTPADHADLLEAMGAETANVHLGSGKRRIAAVRADLGQRGPGWLKDASKLMERLTLADHAAWQGSRRP
jgi:hypothetical protein